MLALGNRLDSRDAALASAIVFGVLRVQRQLDFLIGRYARRDPSKLDVPVLIALRTAIFQLRHLDRVPPHAAVYESVEWVKRTHKSAAPLVNAVLRKISRKPVVWPDAATELSCPSWLLESWTAQFGSGTARQIAAAALEEPAQYVRLSSGNLPDPEWLPTPVPGCFRVPGHAPGGMRLQDIGSQSVIPLLDLQPGHSYLDLCAAPGNKTLQALETALGFAIACDISFQRITRIPHVCHRVVLDGALPLPFKNTFDRVFIDAPCSGTGTLARNPEIKWRLKADEIARFSRRQQAILEQGLLALKPGGRLLYATCSLQAEENQQVVRNVLEATAPGRRVLSQTWRLPGRDEGDGFYACAIA